MDKHNHHIRSRIAQWRFWSYKNTLLLVVSLIAFLFIAETPLIERFIQRFGELGYLGAFVVGAMFASVFTVAPATIILFEMANLLNPLEVAVIAGLGAMAGDYLIFRLFQDKIIVELKPLFKGFIRPSIRKLFRTPYFSWLIPFFGAIIIASPFPDEVGVSILGLSRIRRWQFLLITFILNATGIIFVVALARS